MLLRRAPVSLDDTAKRLSNVSQQRAYGKYIIIKRIIFIRMPVVNNSRCINHRRLGDAMREETRYAMRLWLSYCLWSSNRNKNLPSHTRLWINEFNWFYFFIINGFPSPRQSHLVSSTASRYHQPLISVAEAIGRLEIIYSHNSPHNDFRFSTPRLGIERLAPAIQLSFADAINPTDMET